MQVAFYLAGKITQVKESIPWVRCASGNVFRDTLYVSVYLLYTSNIPLHISCQVPVYYLNADFDYWNILDWNRPDIDCLHTVNLPMKTTIMMIFVHTVNLPTKTRKADNDKDAGGTSLAYA